MTEEEKVICRLYLEDMDRNHTCNEYRLLMELLDKEPCEDTISRKAAIDAIAKYLGRLQPPNTRETWRSTGKAILDIVPPAQPEVIRCKDCKHRDAESGFCEGRGWPIQLVPDDGFCDKGERRE